MTKHVQRVSPYSHASSINPGFVEIGLACIHAYSHSCCAACIRFGAALFSRHPNFFLYCHMYLRFRGYRVVLGIELSVSAWYQKTRRVLLRERRLLPLLLLAAEGRERCAVCVTTCKISFIGAETRRRFCANHKSIRIRRTQNTPA